MKIGRIAQEDVTPIPSFLPAVLAERVEEGEGGFVLALGLQGLQYMIPLRLRFNGITSQRIQEKMDYNGTCSIEIEM
ncbi:hypothetical protein YC2023_044830 [Brassica napus]